MLSIIISPFKCKIIWLVKDNEMKEKFPNIEPFSSKSNWIIPVRKYLLINSGTMCKTSLSDFKLIENSAFSSRISLNSVCIDIFLFFFLSV